MESYLNIQRLKEESWRCIQTIQHFKSSDERQERWKIFAVLEESHSN